MKRFAQLMAAFAIAIAIQAAAAAQGVQTGILTGTVKDSAGLVLPGVTVSVSSPAIQGDRTTVTDENGNYILRGLPPGEYVAKFELSSFNTAEQKTIVPLGGTANLNATLAVATVQENVTVVAETPSALTTPAAGANYAQTEIDKLASGRTPALIAELSPGLTDNTPNAGQVSISGGFAYDNVFLIDGVDVNDNLFGTAHNLFIEDAIEETQVLTSGISAEYGRFSGGVVNVVTKRGGNKFSGTTRINLSNPSWTDETPFEDARSITRASSLSRFVEGTLGGPILKDKLWFFGAVRTENSETAQTLRETGTPNTLGVKNTRGEIKFTGTPWANHTLQGSYMNNSTEQANRPFNIDLAMEPSTMVTRQLPNKLFVVNYNGVLTSKLFGTLQYSDKTFGFRNSGGTSTAIADSPFRTRGVLGVPATLHYNGPMFDSNDPEDRNNRQFAGSLSYFLTTPRFGSHDLKSGFEHFTTTRTGGNNQSATSYIFQSDYLVGADGRPALDGNGRVIPRFVPNTSRLQQWFAERGAQIDVRTLSLFVHDRWKFNERLSLDLGVRYEKVRSEATGDIIGADTSSVVPRLGATYDLFGDGKTVLQASYALYSGKFSESQFARNSNVGVPSLVTRSYTGPAGEGMSFAPGLDPANYTTVVTGSFGTATVSLAPGLKSPTSREFTLSAGREIGSRGYAKVIYTNRDTDDFIEDFITREDGFLNVTRNGVNFGNIDRQVYRNSNIAERQYQGLQFLGQYRAMDNLRVTGHWTVQLENHGNFEGEAANQPGNPSIISDYPEVFTEDRYYPSGRLNDFQRHKVRLWAVYTQDMGRFGSIDLAPLVRYNSALTYTLFQAGVPVSAVQLARVPAGSYANLSAATSASLVFGQRGSEEFNDYTMFDLGLTYQIPVWRQLRPYVQLDLYNIFNNQTLVTFDTTVIRDPNSPLDANGQPTGYLPGANFGQATQAANYAPWQSAETGGRTIRAAVGFRF